MYIDEQYTDMSWHNRNNNKWIDNKSMEIGFFSLMYFLFK